MKFQIFAFICVLSSCAPIKKDSGAGDVISLPDNSDIEGEPQLKIAYDIDDIGSVRIIPEEGQLAPWQPTQYVLAGKLPDKTEGRVPHEVSWTSSDPKVAVIDKESGELVGLAPGSVSISASFRTLSANKSINFRWNKESFENLPEPEGVKANAVDESIAQVEWNFGEGPVTGHQLVYQTGQPPSDCELPMGEGQKVVRANDIGDLTEVTVMGLTPATEYGMRLCAVQELMLGDQSVMRFSRGVTFSLTTPDLEQPDQIND